MAINRGALDSYVLELRLTMLEQMLLKIHILLPLASKPSPGIDRSLEVTLKVLEEVAVSAERNWLTDSNYSSLQPEERAMLADEARELIDGLKQSASEIATEMKKIRTS